MLVAQLGADANHRSTDGFTAAHVAARFGRAAALRVLVEELGASASARAKSGDAPLHVAARYGALGAVRFLAADPAAAYITGQVLQVDGGMVM